MTPISNAKLLLIVLLLQQLLFGLLWLVAARLRLARRPALHWAAMAWLAAGGLAVIVQRGQAPTWLSVGVGNGLLLTAFVAMRRGIQGFARQRPGDGEHAVLLGLGLISALGTGLADTSPLPFVLLATAAMSWTLLRGAAEIRGRLAAEFGRAAATWCASPMALLALLFLVRAAVACFSPAGFQRYLQQPGGGAVSAAFVALVIALLLQVNLTILVLLRLVRRLQYQSDHDMLTGLLSRRPMERLLQVEAQRQRRFGHGFALLSIDIDHFKRVNDGSGHAAGDAVLKRVAQALRDAARDIDSVARMGGEEFCVLLPGADIAGAEAVALRMLEAVRCVHHPELGNASVSVSIGVAAREAPSESIQALQRRLDQALYAAKAAGRDRVQRAATAASAARDAAAA